MAGKKYYSNYKTVGVEVVTNNIPLVKEDLERHIQIALEVLGGTIEGYAIDRCPVGTEESTHIAGYKGGSLRSTIRHEQEDDRTMVVGAGGIKGIYRFVDYAPFVELGTVKMKAQPFMRPAVEEHKDELRKITERAFKL